MHTPRRHSTYSFSAGANGVLSNEDMRSFASRSQSRVLLLCRFEFPLRVEQRGEDDQAKDASVVLFDTREKRATLAVESDVFRAHQIFLHHNETCDKRFEDDIQNGSIDAFGTDAQVCVAKII